uniref:Uncharacterized protein n=1 Tax=Manihot esculenta TaxID=3983 RepID=A0A2C9U5G0_MANES
MAESEYSFSDVIYVNSQELRNQESKLEFSEDEEELLIRMFNLVGKR